MLSTPNVLPFFSVLSFECRAVGRDIRHAAFRDVRSQFLSMLGAFLGDLLSMLGNVLRSSLSMLGIVFRSSLSMLGIILRSSQSILIYEICLQQIIVGVLSV